MTQPDIRAGRSPDEAQPRSTCPVCGGKKFVERRTVQHGLSTTTFHGCRNCIEGTVPAADDLAQWREEAERIVDEAAFLLPSQQIAVSVRLQMLRAHLAAMPTQRDRDCDEQGCLLQGIAHSHEKGEPFCAECAQSLTAQDVNAELREFARGFVCQGHLNVVPVPKGYDCGDPWCKDARDAIAQAETGAAG